MTNTPKMSSISKRNLESLISQFKRDGLSKIQSIVKVANETKIGLDAAKKAVHASEAWASEKAGHEEFENKIAQEIEDMKSDSK